MSQLTPRTHTLECQRHYEASADTIWQTISDFYSNWHPYIESCSKEDGAPIRRFTMPGSDTLYREQLTYLSHTQRQLRYEMLAGIEGVARYQGGVQIDAEDNGGCLLRWWADIDGDEQLVAQIAKGTEQVFEAGFDKIEKLQGKTGQSADEIKQLPGKIERSTGKIDCPILVDASDGENSTANTRKYTQQNSNARRITINSPQAIALSYQGSRHNQDWLCLFLHGIGGNRSNWDTQLAAIAEIMPCAAMDLRGYGDSALGNTQSTVDDYCADIRAVAEQLGCKHLVLAGLSYGAWIATHFALHYPDEKSGLVLCGGCTGMSEASEDIRQGFLRARLEPLDAGKTPADFASGVVEIISGPHATAAQRDTIHESMAAIPAETYRDALHCFTHPPGKFDFAKLSCPALLMTGEHDKLAPPDEIAGVAMQMLEAKRPEHLPLADIQFEVLQGAGHIANLEQAEAYNRYLSRFLEQLSV